MNDERCDRDRVTAERERIACAVWAATPIGSGVTRDLCYLIADAVLPRLLEALDTIDRARELHTPTRFAETDERGYDAWCLHCRAPGPCPYVAGTQRRQRIGGRQVSDERWIYTETEVPPENVVVDTLRQGGTRQKLMRQGNLWFIPDGSMYVYYTPLYWRAASS